MSLSERDFVFLYYITFANCLVGLVYIFILIILISIVVTKYKVRTIQREVDIRVKYENHFRIYEKREKMTINKSNKRLQEIYHSYKAIDKTHSKPNHLCLETIVEINGKKQYSGKEEIENKNQHLSQTQLNYIRDSYETLTKQLIFDRNEQIINRFITRDKVMPIQLTEPLTNQLVKSEVISAKVPIHFQRNRITAQRGESLIHIKSKNQKRTVLDVISYGDSSVEALSITSNSNNMSMFMAQSKPLLTSDSLISNVQFSETEALQSNIQINEIPTVGSHLKINIREKRGHSIQSNVVTTEVIEAEVPLIVDKVITERKVPNLIPISICKSSAYNIL